MKKNVTIRIDDKVYEDIKALAAIKGVSASDAIGAILASTARRNSKAISDYRSITDSVAIDYGSDMDDMNPFTDM